MSVRILSRTTFRLSTVLQYLREHGKATTWMLFTGQLIEVLAFVLDRVTPWDFYSRYLRYVAEGGVVERRIHGYEMYLPVDDEGISQELIWRRTHEPRSTRIFRREIERLRRELPTVTVLEAGANIGYYCLLELETLCESANVIAVEPVPTNADLLRRNLDLNGYQDVPVHRVALSDTAGQETMYLSKKFNWCRLGKPSRIDSGERIEVETNTGDGFVRDLGIDPGDVNVVRMDVQGYEPHVIAGMEAMFSADGPLLAFVEIHREVAEENRMDEVLRPFTDNGFDLVCAHAEAYFRPGIEFDSIEDIYEFPFDEWSDVQLICRRG